MATIEEIMSIYENEIRKNMKNKKQLLWFEKNKMSRIIEIQKKIEKLDNSWNVKYKIFLIQEPKERVIMVLDIDNKIINHYVTRYILIPKLSKRLDNRNVATRKGLGTKEGRRLVKNI